MRIVDPKMAVKMERALKLGLDLYNLEDIGNALSTGHMQAHTVGDTLAITRVNDWPRRKSVDILYVVGNLDEAIRLEQQIEEWSKGVGASLLTASGRKGWTIVRTPGWKEIGTMYAKEI